MINVTRPFLPPREEYEEMLEGVWKRNWLTNSGPLVKKLELQLKEYLGVSNILYVNNGTTALQLAIKALDLKGEIITTPFSFIATTSAIIWESCKPVFADIDPDTFNIDPAKIEALITDKTTGILATHVYGNPCDIDAIDNIARKHNLKVIYDAAHCFGTKYKGKSVFEYGDVSTCSFHATKLFHTIEGGAVFSRDAKLIEQIELMHNFGFNGPEEFACVGINGKNSEFHAAMGLVNMKRVNELLSVRKSQWEHYYKLLKGTVLKHVRFNTGEFNYAYYPVVFETEDHLLKAMDELKANRVFARRYFYPSLSTIQYETMNDAPVCEEISRRVICLPLYHDLTVEEIVFVASVLSKALMD